MKRVEHRPWKAASIYWERAHLSVVISLIASMARFTWHGHPTYSFSNRVSDLIKLRFYREDWVQTIAEQEATKGRPRSRRNFPCSWRGGGCNCLESLGSLGGCVIICTLEETRDSEMIDEKGQWRKIVDCGGSDFMVQHQ